MPRPALREVADLDQGPELQKCPAPVRLDAMHVERAALGRQLLDALHTGLGVGVTRDAPISTGSVVIPEQAEGPGADLGVELISLLESLHGASR